MNFQELERIAQAIVAEGKGILAADESDGTIKKRFDSIGVESSEDTRRAYRELLFTTDGVEEYISGVILYDETIRQKSSDGTPFPKLLESKGIIPGIKVDKGAKPLALAEVETVTEGLDGLRERLAEYRELGARFTKWRAVITIKGRDIPSEYALWTNAHALARSSRRGRASSRRTKATGRSRSASTRSRSSPRRKAGAAIATCSLRHPAWRITSAA
jgi:fructose-bisphosphate aldolase, class I